MLSKLQEKSCKLAVRIDLLEKKLYHTLLNVKMGSFIIIIMNMGSREK